MARWCGGKGNKNGQSQLNQWNKKKLNYGMVYTITHILLFSPYNIVKNT